MLGELRPHEAFGVDQKFVAVASRVTDVRDQLQTSGGRVVPFV
jgi:hypothetical protein